MKLSILILAVCVSWAAADTWKILPGVDNTLDLQPCCDYGVNVTVLQQRCLANKWCAGFSTFYGTLKYSVATYGPQPNTNLYVRQPPPPPIPAPPPVHLWPRPAAFINGNQSIRIKESSFSFLATGAPSKLLDIAFERFIAILFASSTQPEEDKLTDIPVLEGCDVSLVSSDESLFEGVDESYTLFVPSQDGTRAILTANTVFGALRGLETFASLWDTNTQFVFDSAPLTVNDAPRFPYRGLMIDTSRHFLPVSVILGHLMQ